jgi:hypothetical protein
MGRRVLPSLALALVPVLLALGFVRTFAYNWPWADDFGFPLWYQDVVEQRTLAWRDLLAMRISNHPLGGMILVAMGVWRLTGMSFPALMLTSSLLLSGAALLLVSSTAALWCTRAAWLLASLAVPLLLLHPIQGHEVLWGIQLGWCLILGMLVVNLCLLEWARGWGVPVLVLTSSLATLSAGHGVLLWLLAALHCLLLRALPQRGWWAALFACGFVAGLVWVADTHKAAVSSGQLLQAGLDLLQVYGALFGTRQALWLWLLGLLLLGSAGSVLLLLWRLPLDRIIRLGLMLLLASGSFVVTFLVARGNLAWGLTSFHIATLLTPFGAGLAVLALRAWDLGLRPAWRALVPLGLLCSSVVVALPTGVHLAETAQRRRALAMHLSCTPDTPADMLIMANFVPFNLPMLWRSLPLVRMLCQDTVPPQIVPLLTYPAHFTSLATTHPDADAALRTLWAIYITHEDLMEAFPVTDLETPARLLRWAGGNARMGSTYEACYLTPAWTACPLLKPYEAYLATQ